MGNLLQIAVGLVHLNISGEAHSMV